MDIIETLSIRSRDCIIALVLLATVIRRNVLLSYTVSFIYIYIYIKLLKTAVSSFKSLN